MEANEFVGFALPVVNEGPWSYFSNGGNSNGGNDGEDETMIVNGSYAENTFTIDETSKTIFDAIASGKVVIVKIESIDALPINAYSIILEAIFADEYSFNLYSMGELISVTGAADENPTSASDNNN